MGATQEQFAKSVRRTLVIGPLPDDPGFEPTEEEKLAALRVAIDEGDASGVAEDGVFERIYEALGLVRER